MVSKILINRSHPQPATKKAPAGGKIMVTRMRITSEALTISVEYVGCWESVVELDGGHEGLQVATHGVAAVAADITARSIDEHTQTQGKLKV